VVILNDIHNTSQICGIKPLGLHQFDWFKPDFRRATVPGDMDMPRFTHIEPIEMEAEPILAKDRRHQITPSTISFN